MKKLLKIVGGIFLVFIVLGIIGAATGGGKTATSNSGNNVQQAKSQPEAPKVATKVDAKTLVDDFDKNKLAANDKYKGQYMEFTAKVKNISEDITGSPFLSLVPVTADQYYFGTTLACYFKDAGPLKALQNNQNVTLRGTNDGMTVGIIAVKDCQVVQ